MDLRKDLLGMVSYRLLTLWLALVAFQEASARDQTSQCHGTFESDTGSLQIGPSTTSCLWIIKLQQISGFRLELNSNMMEPILVIPELIPSDSNLQYFRTMGSANVSHEFEGKSLGIVVPPGLKGTTLDWTGLNLDESGVSVNTKFVNDSEGTLEWESTPDGIDKLFWAFDYGASGHLNWALNTVVPDWDLENPCDIISFVLLEIMPDGHIREIHSDCGGSSTGFLKVGTSFQALVLLHSVKAEGSLQISWKYEDDPLNSDQKGIIATANGLVMISFNNSTQSKLSGRWIKGLAFDWNSSRIYWLEFNVGIMRSNLDGSAWKILVSDPSSHLRGLSIDPISGNLYYGDWSSGTIRVCSNDAKNCSSIVGSTGMLTARDFAFHRSKGLLFQSIYGHKVLQTNLDGSHATVLLGQLDVRVLGIDVDEHEDRLYWGSNKGIGSCDLSGRDIQMLPNVNAIVEDVVIDGDKVYYSTWKTMSIHVISKAGNDAKLVAKLTGHGYHMALFGPRLPNPQPNPCENSNCAHLCVLINAWSYRCMCPDNKELNVDAETCQL